MSKLEKILVVEDDPTTQVLIKKTIEGEHECIYRDNANDIVDFAKKTSPDLILLDINFPQGAEDGFSACTKLQRTRETKSIPIMFLTSRANISDKIIGFNLGADDYITKPFHPDELAIRIKSKLSKISNQKKKSDVHYIGDLKIDSNSLQAFIKNENGEFKNISLTSLELKLLMYFVRNKNSILSRSQILNNVWGNCVAVVDRNVDVHISFLRKKLLHEGKRLSAVYGLGYQFKA